VNPEVPPWNAVIHYALFNITDRNLGLVHKGLPGWDRVPSKLEDVPKGYNGPIRPVGVDKYGKYTYFERKVDASQTAKRKDMEPWLPSLSG
jgi:hypothetical protein